MSEFAAAENRRSKLLIKKHLLQRIFECATLLAGHGILTKAAISFDAHCSLTL